MVQMETVETPPDRFERSLFGLEVRRIVHYATGATVRIIPKNDNSYGNRTDFLTATQKLVQEKRPAVKKFIYRNMLSKKSESISRLCIEHLSEAREKKGMILLSVIRQTLRDRVLAIVRETS
jgi:hypothetical protein